METTIICNIYNIKLFKNKKEMNILDDKEFYEALNNINKTSEHLSNTIDDFRNFFSK